MKQFSGFQLYHENDAIRKDDGHYMLPNIGNL